jgi:hypothetical protein
MARKRLEETGKRKIPTSVGLTEENDSWLRGKEGMKAIPNLSALVNDIIEKIKKKK